MGLAGLSIALGQNIAPFLDQIVEPIIDSLSHTDSKVRYFACESAYNVAKVAKGEILVGLIDSSARCGCKGCLTGSLRCGAALIEVLQQDLRCALQSK